MLAGQVDSRVPLEVRGYLMRVLDPGLFGDVGKFRAKVSEFAGERERRLVAGVIEVQDLVVKTLRDVCAQPA
ncbi:hypothetical protein ACT80S_16225 [Ramlibacter sp. MAHUQ-53]|uniref:hypothetical protein n=1 Tax=unclassified Ramlibacter TaxID=2617605 RepID=UPI0036281E50